MTEGYVLSLQRGATCLSRGPGQNPLFDPCHLYYYGIGEPSSTFDEYLAVRSQFDTDHGVDFLRLHLANQLPLCDRLLRYIVLCFLRKKKKIMRHLVTDAAMFTLRD